MNVTRYIFIALALSFIVGFPYKAFSDKHIPFYATYPKEDGAPELGIACSGPWFRHSKGTISGIAAGCEPIPAGGISVEFYSAEVTKFSPYGKWTCTVYSDWYLPFGGQLGGSYICTDEVADVVFHLNKDNDEVNLTMTKDSLTADLSQEVATITAAATLGDDNTKPKRDRDTWTIQGTEGDNVVITLEEDPEAGHDGEQATLILRNGSRTIESKTDALPIEISATLPSDGEYELVVQQQNIPEDVRFRGNYYLSVKSDSGDIQEIKPSDDVEQ